MFAQESENGVLSEALLTASPETQMPQWAKRLAQYVDENAIRGGNFDAEHDVELRMKEIFNDRLEKVVKTEPTFTEIPRFYFAKPVVKSPKG